VTAEHASEALPAPWQWPAEDRKRLLGTHWSHDVGSHFIASAMVNMLKCSALFANYSRLLIDPNRPLNSSTLIRTEADGVPVELNKNLHKEDRKRRIRDLYVPYHKKLLELNRGAQVQTVFSVHSFNPTYEGKARKVEIGVLFQKEEELAKKFVERFVAAGFDARLNEPWSGKEGFMYAAHRTEKQALMFEFRNDLLRSKEFCEKVLIALLDVIYQQELHKKLVIVKMTEKRYKWEQDRLK